MRDTGEVIQGREIKAGVIMGEGAPPLPMAGVRTVRGPSKADILELGRQEWMLVKLDEVGVTLVALRQRVTQANAALASGEQYHYTVYQTAENRAVIACVHGAPLRRK